MTLRERAVAAAVNGEWSDEDRERWPQLQDDGGEVPAESRFDRLRRRVFTLDQLASLPPVEYLIPGFCPAEGSGFSSVCQATASRS